MSRETELSYEQMLAAKDATHEKQLNAHKSLIQSLENQRTTLREGAEKWAEAVKSLLSEREANSLLTNEIDALTAERDDLRTKIAIIRQDSNREYEDFRNCRDRLRVALLDVARLKAELDAELYRFARSNMTANEVRQAWQCGLDESMIDRNIKAAMQAQEVKPS